VSARPAVDGASLEGSLILWLDHQLVDLAVNELEGEVRRDQLRRLQDWGDLKLKGKAAANVSFSRKHT